MRVVILKLNLKGNIEVELIEILGDCLDIRSKGNSEEKGIEYNCKASCLGD